MYSKFALDRAHRYDRKLLCLVWFMFQLTSSSIFLPVHSAPSISPLLNVSASSVKPTINVTNLSINISSQDLSAQLSVPKSYLLNDTNNISPVKEDVPTTLSVVVPKTSLNIEHASQDDLLDFNFNFGSFLLMCAVKSIRYWSPKCALHSSNELLAHSPSVNKLRNGFSGMSLRRSSANNSTELVWFDVEKYEFHLARFAIRVNKSQCESPLTFNYNTTLDYSTNSRASDYANNKEKMVKLASSENHLFVSNFHLDRIDVYRVNESNSSLTHVESIITVGPSNIVFQKNNLFWLENHSRICRLKNFFDSNLRPSKPQCHDRTNGRIFAFTVLKDGQIIYAASSINIHVNIYRFNLNSFKAQMIGSVELPNVVSMTAMNSNVIFFTESDGQVHRLNISNGLHDLEAVSIESNTIFDITFLSEDFGKLFDESYVEEDEEEIIIQVNGLHRILILSISAIVLVLCLILSLIICLRKPAVRQRFTSIQSKLPNARGLLRNIRPYAQMRQTRASSISNALIEEEDENVSNYKQNISTHRPIAANDIEDLLGNRQIPTQSSARCIACRDPGVCQDKGLCMAVYRAQQP